MEMKEGTNIKRGQIWRGNTYEKERRDRKLTLRPKLRRDTHREETRTEKGMRDTLCNVCTCTCTYREGSYMEKGQTRRRDYIVKELHNFKS